jgi:branched-chain amino acid transport system permease protein
MTQAILSGLLVGGLYALLSLGFALKLRIADTVNLAYGGFVVLGMYATLVLVNDMGIPMYVAVVVASLFVAVFSYVVHVVVIGGPGRTGHAEQIIYTLILLSVIEIVLQWRFGSALQSLSVPATAVVIGDAVVSLAQLIAGVAAVVLALALFFMFKYTQFGKTLEVAGKYPDGARAIGVPVERVYRGVFVLGGALAGVAGGLIMTFFPVDPFLGLEFVLVALVVAIVARLSFVGCLVAGLGYGLLESVLQRAMSPEMAQIYIFAIFLVVLAGERLIAWSRQAWAGRKMLTRSAN